MRPGTATVENRRHAGAVISSLAACYGDVDADGSVRIVARGDEQEALAEVGRPGVWREGAEDRGGRSHCLS